MADYQFTPQQKQCLQNEGLVEGMKKLVSSNSVSPEVAGGYLSGWLGFWTSKELDEAAKEIHHLQSAIARLQQLSRSIEQSKKIAISDPRIGQLMNELKTFDGWLVSLFETDLTLYGFYDPKRARAKLTELNSAMTALLNKRQTDQSPFEKDPSLFKTYVG